MVVGLHDPKWLSDAHGTVGTPATIVTTRRQLQVTASLGKPFWKPQQHGSKSYGSAQPISETQKQEHNCCTVAMPSDQPKETRKLQHQLPQRCCSVPKGHNISRSKLITCGWAGHWFNMVEALNFRHGLSTQLVGEPLIEFMGCSWGGYDGIPSVLPLC